LRCCLLAWASARRTHLSSLSSLLRLHFRLALIFWFPFLLLTHEWVASLVVVTFMVVAELWLSLGW
jgi:hypothetical protein